MLRFTVRFLSTFQGEILLFVFVTFLQYSQNMKAVFERSSLYALTYAFIVKKGKELMSFVYNAGKVRLGKAVDAISNLRSKQARRRS